MNHQEDARNPPGIAYRSIDATLPPGTPPARVRVVGGGRQFMSAIVTRGRVRLRVLARYVGVSRLCRSGRRLIFLATRRGPTGAIAGFRYRRALRAAARGEITAARNGLRQCERVIPGAVPLRQRLDEMIRVLRAGAPPLPPRNGTGSGRGGALFALHNSLPYDGAGYALRSHMLLSRLAVRGVSCRVVTRPGYPRDLHMHRHRDVRSPSRVDGVDYHPLDDGGHHYNRVPDSTYVDWYARQLAREARHAGSAVLHGASNYLNGLAAITAARHLGLPAVYELRGLWHYSRAAREPAFRHSELYAYQDRMERHAARHADAVIVLSEAMKSHLIRQWRLFPRRVHVVANAVDTARFQPLPRDHALRAALGMKGRRVVGYIGSLADYEGLDDLIRAVALLGDDYGLVIVGDGRARPSLEALVRRLRCGRRVRFTGRVPFTEARQYYAGFDLCAYPRKDRPVCRYVPPLKPLEALAMGCPVVVSDLPPLREQTEGCPHALRCRPDHPESLADGIASLVLPESPVDLHRWTAAHHGVDRAVDALLAVHRAVGAGPAAARYGVQGEIPA